MNENLKMLLLMNETNLDDAINRFSGDEKLYIQILLDFPNDKTIIDLKNTIHNQSWDDAFTAAHALKGLAGNLGLTPLFHAVGELVIIIRTGRIKDIEPALNKVEFEYDEVIKIINHYINEERTSNE